MMTTNFKERYTYFDMPELTRVLPDFLGKYLMSHILKRKYAEKRIDHQISIVAEQGLSDNIDIVDNYCTGQFGTMSDYTDEQITNLTLALCVIIHDGFYDPEELTPTDDIRVLLSDISHVLETKADIEHIEKSGEENMSLVDFSNFPKEVADILNSERFFGAALHIKALVKEGKPEDFNELAKHVHVKCQTSKTLSKFTLDEATQLTAYLCHLLSGNEATVHVTVSKRCDVLLDRLIERLAKDDVEEVIGEDVDIESTRVTAGEVDKVIRHLTDTAIATNDGHVKFTPNGLQKLLVLLHEENVLTHL